jgi:peptidoglycan/LPS O-acetylase OafA/YrhL
MAQGAFNPRKNSDIEVLQAFAILFTLFLVISGFVIAGSVMESRADGAPRKTLMFAFWIKRIFRLLPAAWTWILVAAVLQLSVSYITGIDYALRDVLIRSASAAFNLGRR